MPRRARNVASPPPGGPPPPARPVITLTTDFGTTDFYASAMKAVLLRHCPQAALVDVTHQIPRHYILYASVQIERAVASFFPGTVHVAVVDPGVGSARRLLVVRLREQFIICPDNGLITWAWRRCGPAEAFELTWRPESTPSTTFHGRDILAPAAAMLAAGTSLADLARPIADPILLDVRPAESTEDDIRVLHIDHFGNATTNLLQESITPPHSCAVRVGRRELGPVRGTYSDVKPGRPLALIGSSGLLEIAIREGSAAMTLGLKVGDRVHVRRREV